MRQRRRWRLKWKPSQAQQQKPFQSNWHPAAGYILQYIQYVISIELVLYRQSPVFEFSGLGRCPLPAINMSCLCFCVSFSRFNLVAHNGPAWTLYEKWIVLHRAQDTRAAHVSWLFDTKQTDLGSRADSRDWVKEINTHTAEQQQNKKTPTKVWNEMKVYMLCFAFSGCSF